MADLQSTAPGPWTKYQTKPSRWQDAPIVGEPNPRWQSAPIVGDTKPGPWTKYGNWRNDPIVGEPKSRWQDKAIPLDGTGWRSKAIPLDGQNPATAAQPQPAPQPAPDPDQAYIDFITSPATPPGAPGPKPAPEPPGFYDRHPEYDWRGGGSDDPNLRALKIGTQATGSGIADLIGAPVDLTTLALNAPLAIGDYLSGGGLPFRFQDAIGGSQSIRDAASVATDAALGPNVRIAQEDMTPSERIGYEAERFAAGAAAGSGIISKARNIVPRSLSAPYVAEGSDARVFAGDVAAGAGSGALTGAYHEYAPESWQGPIADLLVGLAGGVGGAGSLRTAERMAGAGGRTIDARVAMPRDIVDVDPVTRQPVSVKDFKIAASMLQDKAYNPEKAQANIGAYLKDIGDGDAPTLGPLSADPGLLAAERRARATNPAPFIARDQAVMDSVSQRIAGVRPEGADPETPRPAAGRIIEDRLNRGRSDVANTKAAAKVGDDRVAALAAEIASGRSADQASRDLHRNIVDETYIPDRSAKNTAFDDAAANPEVVVRTENARAAAARALAEAEALNPALRDDKSLRIADAFAVPVDEAGAPTGNTLPARPGDAASATSATEPPVTRKLSEVLRDRAALTRVETEARAQGNFGLADTARAVRAGINKDVETAATSGVPGTEKLAAADDLYLHQDSEYFSYITMTYRSLRAIYPPINPPSFVPSDGRLPEPCSVRS